MSIFTIRRRQSLRDTLAWLHDLHAKHKVSGNIAMAEQCLSEAALVQHDLDALGA